MSADGKSNIYQVFLKAYLHHLGNIAWGEKICPLGSGGGSKKWNLTQEIQY